MTASKHPGKKKRKRSTPFHATRKHHSSEAAEDYTELIADLIEEHGEARTGSIADHLGISHVTALRTIRRLQNEGYVTTSPHQPVELTTRGKRLAQYAKERHRLLVEFLVKIGVPPETAEIDVEGAEHHISKTTLDCIRSLLDRLELLD